MSFIKELKRRNVFRMAVLYAIASWLIMQVAEVVIALANLPEWIGPTILGLLAIGFPIALIFSWFYELTPEGISLEKDVHLAESITHITGRRLDLLVISLLCAAVILFTWHTWWPFTATELDRQKTGLETEIAIYSNSIAVLPFLNIDGSAKTRAFSTGLAEDLLNRLATIPNLRVSARGDSFSLAANTASDVVRERLRVAYYLEGSVRLMQDRLRVVIQLINSEDGFHLVSRQFDRELKEYFELQDEITHLTVATLRVALPPETRSHSYTWQGRTDIDAYILYQRGLEAFYSPNRKDIATALDWFQQALQIDAEYAAAHAGICRAYIKSYRIENEPKLVKKAENACAQALALNPNLDIVHVALGDLFSTTGRYIDAKKEYKAALVISPHDVAALLGLATALSILQEEDEAERMIKMAVDTQPGNWNAYRAYGNFLYKNGRYREAAEQYRKVITLDQNSRIGFASLGTALMLSGDFETSAQALERSIDIAPSATAYSNLGLAIYYLGDYEQAAAIMLKAVEISPKDHLAWANLGDALYHAAKTEDARQAFEKAYELASTRLEMNPNSALTLMDSAWISAMLGNFVEAQELIARAENLSPGDPYLHYFKALIQIRLGNLESACDDLEKAAQLNYPLEIMAEEPYFEPLRGNPRFEALISQRSNGVEKPNS